MYTIHRLIWRIINDEIPENLVIDHIDRNKLNNNVLNFRLISSTDNCQNKDYLTDNNLTGYIGVRNRHNGRFTAYIMKNLKSIALGAFDSAEEASEAYLSARAKYHNYSTESTIINHPEFIVSVKGVYIGSYSEFSVAKQI